MKKFSPRSKSRFRKMVDCACWKAISVVAVIKISAVKAEHHVIEAPVQIFETQHGIRDAFEAGELNKDVIAVCRFQGPRANGMPELHKTDRRHWVFFRTGASKSL